MQISWEKRQFTALQVSEVKVTVMKKKLAKSLEMIHAEKSDWLIAKFIHSLINHLQGRDRGGLRVSKDDK